MLRRWRRDVDVDRRCATRRYHGADHPSDERRAVRLPGVRRECGRDERAFGVVRCRYALPILVLLGVLLAGGRLAAFAAVYRGRPRGYVVVVVDVVHSANLGHGSRLGFDFVRDPVTRTITGIDPARGG